MHAGSVETNHSMSSLYTKKSTHTDIYRYTYGLVILAHSGALFHSLTPDVSQHHLKAQQTFKFRTVLQPAVLVGHMVLGLGARHALPSAVKNQGAQLGSN